MKNLKDYINNNRGTFDDKEPPAGHAERFEALLDRKEKELKAEKGTEKKSAKRIQLRYIMSVAASIAILAVVFTQFYRPSQNLPTEADTLGIELNTSEEFRATNEYYNQQMDDQIANIMCKLEQTDLDNQRQLTGDLQRIIDENKEFVKEIANNENEELAIHYLVKHYKANIQALENIDEKLGQYVEC